MLTSEVARRESIAMTLIVTGEVMLPEAIKFQARRRTRIGAMSSRGLL